MGKVQVEANKCERCDHVWLPRNNTDEPKVCPSCKSPYWNTPRKQNTSEPNAQKRKRAKT